MDTAWITSCPIAHRGLHQGSVVPENSLPAFELAIERSYPIELDVQLLGDGLPVVFHDSCLSRVAGDSRSLRSLAWNDLSQVRLFNSVHAIPSFESVLASVAGRVPLLIELKSEDRTYELEAKVLDLVRQYRHRFAIQSFNPFSLGFFKQNAPEIPRGQLSGGFESSAISRWKRALLRRCLLNFVGSPDFIAYDWQLLPNRWVDRARTQRNIPLLAWTVRSRHEQSIAEPLSNGIIFEGFLPVSNL